MDIRIYCEQNGNNGLLLRIGDWIMGFKYQASYESVYEYGRTEKKAIKKLIQTLEKNKHKPMHYTVTVDNETF